MSCTVIFTDHFTVLFAGLSAKEQELVEDFVFYAESTGLGVLPHTFPDQITSTAKVPHGARDRAAKIAFAQAHNLWHAHIGYLQWNSSKNQTETYKTSKYVVHFQKLNDESIVLVDYGDHSPMKQPLPHHLFKP